MLSWLYTVYIKTVKKNGNRLSFFFTQLHLVSKKMRFSKIANLLNAPAIHNQKIIVRAFQLPPAVAYRTHTEPLPRQARSCFIPSPQRPHRPVRACFPPAVPQSTLLFNGVYNNSEKRESVISISIQVQLVKKNGYRKLQISKRARNT